MITEDQIQFLRQDTPATQKCNHLNNAGAALMPNPVISTIKNHIDLEAAMGGYEAAFYRRKEIEFFYILTAQLIGAHPKNIAFTSNATDSYNRALSSIPFKSGDTILTTSNDYASNIIAFLSLKNRIGIQIKLLANNQEGEVDLLKLREDLIKYHPRLLAITHIPTNSGLIQPVEEIGKIAQEFETVYLVDGCQSVGQLSLDMDKIGCDFFSATARKFLRGPRGAGFLYVSDKMLVENYAPLFLDMRGADWIGVEKYQLRADAKRFEDWENAYALLLGTAEATKYLLNIGISPVQTRIKSLADKLRSILSEHPLIQVLDRGQKKGGIVTLHLPRTKPEKIKVFLNQEKINCSIVVLSSALVDFKEKGVNWALRFSPHYYNTENEIQSAAEAVHTFASRL